VAWQDELRRLDEELAAGRLSAEEYRQLRDALLASQGRAGQQTGQQTGQQAGQQAGQPADASPAAPSTGEQPAAEQQQPAAGGSPFPPPFKWDSSDSTQVMPATRGNAESDTTQVVQGQAAQQGEDADRTQVVPHSASQQPMQQQPMHQQMQQGPPPLGYSAPSWQQVGDQGQHAPPWAGQDLPPIGQEPTWLRQGPEVFDSGGKSSTGMILAVVALVLVVLLGAGAVYWFGFRDSGGNTPPAASSTTQPSPTTTTVVKPDGPFVELDGQILVNDTYTMADAAKVNRPSKTEVQTLTEAGTETVAGYVTESDDIRTGIWTFTPKSGVAAQTLLEAIDQLYRNAKYQELPGVASGVRARHLAGAQDGSTPTAYRAHYLHDGVVVRVEAYGSDADAVEQKFTELLGRQLDDYPVS
jgi:hypothetical protein